MRQASKAPVAANLFRDADRFSLDALGQKLEQLLRVLVLSRREQGIMLPRAMIGKRADDIHRAYGMAGGGRGVEP